MSATGIWREYKIYTPTSHESFRIIQKDHLGWWWPKYTILKVQPYTHNTYSSSFPQTIKIQSIKKKGALGRSGGTNERRRERGFESCFITTVHSLEITRTRNAVRNGKGRTREKDQHWSRWKYIAPLGVAKAGENEGEELLMDEKEISTADTCTDFSLSFPLSTWTTRTTGHKKKSESRQRALTGLYSLSPCPCHGIPLRQRIYTPTRIHTYTKGFLLL